MFDFFGTTNSIKLDSSCEDLVILRSGLGRYDRELLIQMAVPPAWERVGQNSNE